MLRRCLLTRLPGQTAGGILHPHKAPHRQHHARACDRLPGQTAGIPHPHKAPHLPAWQGFRPLLVLLACLLLSGLPPSAGATPGAGAAALDTGAATPGTGAATPGTTPAKRMSSRRIPSDTGAAAPDTTPESTGAAPDDETAAPDDTTPESTGATPDDKGATPDDSAPDPYLLLDRIRRGEASFVEVRQALSNPDIGAVTNVFHAMYSMRWQRLSMRLMLAVWQQDDSLRERYPELAWDALASVPVRLALASTLLRIQSSSQPEADTDPYLKYLLEHRYDAHEFHRAQVVVALGLNGNPDDIDYLLEQAAGDNPYVVQAAVTSLGLMRSPKAKRGLGSLWKQHRGTPRGELIEQVLRSVYRVTPHIRGEEQEQQEEQAPPARESPAPPATG